MTQINSTAHPARTPAQVNALIAVAAGVHVVAAVPVVVNPDRPGPAGVLAAAAAVLALVLALSYGWRSRVGAPAPGDPSAHTLTVLLCCGTLLWPALVLMLWPGVFAVLIGLFLGAVWVTTAGMLLPTWQARSRAR